MIRQAEGGTNAAKTGWLDMGGFTKMFSSKIVLRIAALATATIAVSGCTYDVGLGYASDGYGYGGGSDYYDCDPYSPFDNYYDCDRGYGYSNIGFGGGWYDNLWYPGYGFFLFDNYGQRYNMRDNYRRYWGERRQRWYRENYRRHDGGARRDGRNYRGGGMDSPGWPERNGGRIHDDERGERNRGDGRRGRNRGWEGSVGNGADAVPRPNPEVVLAPGRGQGYGRRGRNSDNNNDAAPAPQSEQPEVDRNQGPRNGEDRGFRQSQMPQASVETEVSVYQPAPAPTDNNEGQQEPRLRSSDGVIDRPN